MGVRLDSLPHPLLGTRGPRRWSSTTQVSDSAGHSVQLGWAPKSIRCLSLLEMWRRHKVTVAKKEKGGREGETAHANRWNKIFQPNTTVTSPILGTRTLWPALTWGTCSYVRDWTYSNMTHIQLRQYLSFLPVDIFCRERNNHKCCKY